MSKSDVHAMSSAKKFGGKATDYIEIHEMMDSSKAYCSDNRHRSLFHHSAGIYYMQKMFGVDFEEIDRLKEKYGLGEEFVDDILLLLKMNRLKGVHIVNSEKKLVHVRNVAEQHILEDFRGKFIPNFNDYVSTMKLTNWMNNALGPLENNIKSSESFSAVLNID